MLKIFTSASKDANDANVSGVTLRSASPPLPPSPCLTPRVFGADGHEVSPGVQPADHRLQHVPDVGAGGLRLAPPPRPSGQTGQDQRLDRRHQQPLRMAPGAEPLRHSATPPGRVCPSGDAWFSLWFCRWTWSLLRRSRGSSHRAPKTLALSSLSLLSKWLTVMTDGAGPS